MRKMLVLYIVKKDYLCNITSGGVIKIFKIKKVIVSRNLHSEISYLFFMQQIMNNTQTKDVREWIILVSLFRSTVEQTNMLTGKSKRETKLIFNKWQKIGFKLLDVVERESWDNDLEQVTETIEGSISKLRNQLNYEYEV